MKVLILRGVVLEGGITTRPGDKVDVDDQTASYLIRQGKAKAVKAVPRKKAVKKDDA